MHALLSRGYLCVSLAFLFTNYPILAAVIVTSPGYQDDRLISLHLNSVLILLLNDEIAGYIHPFIHFTWNSLPAAVQEADSLHSFKHKLKTDLFTLCFND